MSNQQTSGKRAYEVTAFQALNKGGSLMATVMTVEVEQPVEWVKRHVEEIASQGLRKSRHLGPAVALWVQEAMGTQAAVGAA